MGFDFGSLCELISTRTGLVSATPTWDINEDISEDEITRVILGIRDILAYDFREDLLDAYPNEICMDFAFVPHFTVPSFWHPLLRSRPVPISQRTKKTDDTAPEAFFVIRW